MRWCFGVFYVLVLDLVCVGVGVLGPGFRSEVEVWNVGMFDWIQERTKVCGS